MFACLQNFSNIKGIKCGLLTVMSCSHIMVVFVIFVFFFSLPTGLCHKLRKPTVAEQTLAPLQKQNMLNC